MISDCEESGSCRVFFGLGVVCIESEGRLMLKLAVSVATGGMGCLRISSCDLNLKHLVYAMVLIRYAL